MSSYIVSCVATKTKTVVQNRLHQDLSRPGGNLPAAYFLRRYGRMTTGNTPNNNTTPPLVPPAIGDSVRIKGLISSSQYNDHKGLVVSCPETNDGNRYGVRFRYNGSNKIVSIHISNLDFIHRSSTTVKAKTTKTKNNAGSSANAEMEEEEVEDEQMKQQILHKQEFDCIRIKYNLDNPINAERIADMLSSSSSNSTAVSAAEFATTFGMQVSEAVIFLEWIMIGVKFKEDVLDKNR